MMLEFLEQYGLPMLILFVFTFILAFSIFLLLFWKILHDSVAIITCDRTLCDPVMLLNHLYNSVAFFNQSRTLTCSRCKFFNIYIYNWLLQSQDTNAVSFLKLFSFSNSIVRSLWSGKFVTNLLHCMIRLSVFSLIS